MNECKHKGKCLLNNLDGNPPFCAICHINELTSEIERERELTSEFTIALIKAEKKAKAFREALEMIVGIRPCVNNLMSNAEIANEVLQQKKE